MVPLTTFCRNTIQCKVTCKAVGAGRKPPDRVPGLTRYPQIFGFRIEKCLTVT